MSTTLLAGPATVTVINAAATVTRTIETTIIKAPDPVFINDFFAGLSLMNVGIFLAALLVLAILGFSRLLAIPLFASLFGAIDNGLEWYSYASLYPLKNRSPALVFADLAWGAQDACLTLYSFCLLEKILRGKQRKFFMVSFTFLFLCVVGERLAITILHNEALDGTHDYLYPIISEVNRAYFLTLATLEIVSACFLLRVFYKAHHRSNSMVTGKTGANSGLFAQLAHSSEVRVATLAGIGITRAICFPFDNPAAGGFDRMAYAMENAFPIFLLIDLLTTRVAKLQATVDSHAGDSTYGNSMEKSVASRRSNNAALLGSASGKGAVESISRDFPAYVGKGSWAVSTATQPAAVAEAPEELEEVSLDTPKADKQSV